MKDFIRYAVMLMATIVIFVAISEDWQSKYLVLYTGGILILCGRKHQIFWNLVQEMAGMAVVVAATLLIGLALFTYLVYI